MRKKILPFTLMLLYAVFTSTAQEISSEENSPTGRPLSGQDSIRLQEQAEEELRKQKIANRNFHYNILGGPSYSPDFGLLVGGSALMTFRINPKDTTMKRSVIPATLVFMFNGGLNIFVKPQLFFKDDRFRIFGQFLYKNTRENFYGVGYDTNKNYTRSDTTSRYRYSGMQINPWFLFRIGKSNFFVGPQIDITYDRITDPAKHMIGQEDYKLAGGDASGYKNFSSGIGFVATYDTRDVPANPYDGIYLNISGLMYEKFLGSNTEFYRIELDYRQYKQVGERRVLAWTVQSKHTLGKTGNIPLNKYVLLGSPFDLRGYYQGQYRDKSTHLVMMEYRHMFNTDKSSWIKRVLNRLGFVAWGGCGFMGSNPGEIEGVLPNAGLGLRIEVQPRMNVRLDFGRDFTNDQNLFYFNMTEAF